MSSSRQALPQALDGEVLGDVQQAFGLGAFGGGEGVVPVEQGFQPGGGGGGSRRHTT